MVKKTPPRWIRVMPDYMSSGLWAKEGSLMPKAEVPLSDALMKRLKAWCAKYDRDEIDGDLELAAFSAEGLEIAKALKAEFPDCVVVYFDEARMAAGAPLDCYEYEVSI